MTLSSVPGLQYVLWRDERRRSVTRIQRSGFRPFRNIRGVRGSKRSSGWAMSALPPEADIRRLIEHVCFVPRADPPRRPWCRIQSAGPSQSPPSVTAGWDASRTARAGILQQTGNLLAAKPDCFQRCVKFAPQMKKNRAIAAPACAPLGMDAFTRAQYEWGCGLPRRSHSPRR